MLRSWNNWVTLNRAIGLLSPFAKFATSRFQHPTKCEVQGRKCSLRRNTVCQNLQMQPKEMIQKNTGYHIYIYIQCSTFMHFPSILRQRSLPAERQLCYLQSSERTGKCKQFGLPASHSATWDPMPMSTHLQEGKDTSSQAFLARRNRRRQHPTNTSLGVSWDWNIE